MTETVDIPVTVTVTEHSTDVETSALFVKPIHSPFSRSICTETVDVTQYATTTQIIPTTRVWVSTETLDKTKVVEHTLTATETSTKIWTYATTETDTKTETATETQTYLATVTQSMSYPFFPCDPCFASDFFERVVYTKVVPTTYVSVWESTVVEDQTHTVVEMKSKTGGFFPHFSSCL